MVQIKSILCPSHSSPEFPILLKPTWFQFSFYLLQTPSTVDNLGLWLQLLALTLSQHENIHWLIHWLFSTPDFHAASPSYLLLYSPFCKRVWVWFHIIWYTALISARKLLQQAYFLRHFSVRVQSFCATIWRAWYFFYPSPFLPGTSEKLCFP